MKFDESKVYTALNADELKIGSKVIVANNLKDLKDYIVRDCTASTLRNIRPEDETYRFSTDSSAYALAYLIEAPAKLKWTDLKVGDIIRRGYGTRMVVGIDADSSDMHIYSGTAWLDDEELEEWEVIR